MIKSFYRRCAIYITALSLVLALAFPASAIVPIVIAAGAEVPIIASGTAAAISSAYVWGSAIFHAAVVGAISYYTLGASGSDSHKVNTITGDIGRTANVNWVEFDSDSKSWKTMQAPVAVKVPLDTVDRKSNSNPTKYPTLKSKIDSAKNPLLAANSNDGWGVGGVYKYNNDYYTITGIWNNTVQQGSNSVSKVTIEPSWSSTMNSYYMTKLFSGSPTYNVTTFTLSRGTVAPPLNPKPDPSKFAASVGSAGTISDSVIKSEIDEMIKEYDNDNYSFNILDTASAVTAANGSASPVSLPYSALSKSQVDSIRAGQAAAAAADNAYKQYSTTKSPVDYQKWLDAQALDLATNSTAKPEESPTDVNSAITAANGRYDGVIEQPQKLSLKDLVNGFIASSPFHSIISGTNFSLSGATSSITLTVRGKNYSIDFSRWQTQLELLGSLILTSVHLSAVWIVLGRRD
jgi:hypothetical protein